MPEREAAYSPPVSAKVKNYGSERYQPVATNGWKLRARNSHSTNYQAAIPTKR